MRAVRFGARLLIASICALLTCCGYTTKSLLPSYAKTIHVEPIRNEIDTTREISDKAHYMKYRHFLEVDITNALIDRFTLDGTLKVASPDKADLLLQGELMEYRKDPLRYSDNDEVEEYRISIIVDMAVIDKKTGDELWSDQVIGETTYFTTGALAQSEDDAATQAAGDLARRAVEHTIEVW